MLSLAICRVIAAHQTEVDGCSAVTYAVVFSLARSCVRNTTIACGRPGLLLNRCNAAVLRRLVAVLRPSIETVTPPGHDVSMTQLFDTGTYEDLDQPAAGRPHSDSARHLRSMPTGQDTAARTTQWRLDERTIEVGRRGIEAARQALQEAARSSSNEKAPRKAA